MHQSASERLRRQIEEEERLWRAMFPNFDLLRQVAEAERLRRQMFPTEDLLQQLRQAEQLRRQADEMTRSLYGCSMAEHLGRQRRLLEAMEAALGIDRFDAIREAMERTVEPIQRSLQSGVSPALHETFMASAQRFREQIEQAGLDARLPGDLVQQIAEQWKWTRGDLRDAVAAVGAMEWTFAQEILAELDAELQEDAAPDEAKAVLQRVFEAIGKIWEQTPSVAKIILIWLFSHVADKAFDAVWDGMPAMVEQLLDNADADDVDPEVLSAYRAVTTATEVRALAHDDAAVIEWLDAGHLLFVIVAPDNWVYVSYTRVEGGSGRGWVCADHVAQIRIDTGTVTD